MDANSSGLYAKLARNPSWFDDDPSTHTHANTHTHTHKHTHTHTHILGGLSTSFRVDGGQVLLALH